MSPGPTSLALEQDVVTVARGSSSGATDGPAFQARVRLYLAVLLAISVLLHLMIVVARLLDGHRAFDVLLDADALRRFALVCGSAGLLALVSARRLSRRALRAIDGGAALLFAIVTVLGIPLRAPELRPEMSAILTVALILVGRAAVVPSSAQRTIVVGALAFLPLLLAAPLFYPVDRMVAGIPHRKLVWVGALGFGGATLVVTAVTSRVIYDLRRTVRKALKLGPYEIGRKLGEGGMGAVYEARHAVLRRKTALKLIKASHRDAAAEARFAREAQLTSELSHPNTVALYDYGQTADGIYYYAMELVNGITLHDLVRLGGPLPAGRALGLLRQVAASLAQAHRHGLIHRDIKPSNVMVCYRDGHPDCVKVLDFGLAKRVPTMGGARMSQVDVRAGTPEFMAPEAVYDPRAVGPATDVYAVGVLGYFLLTGTVPFDGRDMKAIAYAHLAEPPLPPSLRREGGVPEDLEEVLMACLAKEPAHRIPDGQALLRALEACEDEGSWSAEDAEQWWRSWDAAPAVDPEAATARVSEVTRRVPEPEPASTKVFALMRRKAPEPNG